MGILSKIDFELIIPSDIDEIFKLITNYERFPEFFENQLKSVKIYDSNNSKVTTEETMVFSTLFKHELIQRSIHEHFAPNKILTKVISGPFENSTMEVLLDKIDEGTKISVKIELKLIFKYKILEPIIKKKYKIIFTALLYKINNIIQNQ